MQIERRHKLIIKTSEIRAALQLLFPDEVVVRGIPPDGKGVEIVALKDAIMISYGRQLDAASRADEPHSEQPQTAA